MPSPSPGMDPYVEHPTLWPGVHNGLIAVLQLALAPQLRPRYYVALEERIYVTEPEQRTFVGRPDVAVVAPPETELTPSRQQTRRGLIGSYASRDCAHEFFGHTRAKLAHAALSTAIALYRAMEMTFRLPQAAAALAQVT